MKRKPAPDGWNVHVRRWMPFSYDAVCTSTSHLGFRLSGGFRWTAVRAHNDMVREITAWAARREEATA